MYLFLLLLMLFALPACAQAPDNTSEKPPASQENKNPVITLPADASVTTSSEADVIQMLTNRLTMVLGGMPIKSITPSPVPNFYQVLLAGEVLYITADGRFVFAGNLIDLQSQVNLTEQAQTQAQLAELKAVAKKDMVVFPARIQQRELWIFTDIDCPYCRRLHQEVPELNRNGVTVNYLFFPRSGPNTPSFQKAVNVWCANNRQEAMNRAKNQETLPNLSCENKILDQYQLSQTLGINGTPYMLSDNGRVIPGFAPAAEIIKSLR
jgi:thiol:disulfide interchange protein DsbC